MTPTFICIRIVFASYALAVNEATMRNFLCAIKLNEDFGQKKDFKKGY